MKIEKLPSGSYRVRKMVDGKKLSLTFDRRPTQADVIAAISQRLNEDVRMDNAPRKSFYECAHKYLDIKSNVLSASTKRGYESLIKNIDAEFGSLLLSEITQQVIQQYINRLSSNHSPKTVRNYFGFISVVISAFIPDASFNITLPRERKKDPEDDYVPTSDEVAAILDKSIEKYKLVFILAIYGLRRSEILALTLDDIGNDFVRVNKAMVEGPNKEWIVQNYNKTFESNRVVAIDPSLKLKQRFEMQGHIYNGHPSKIYDYLIRKQKQLGIHHFKLHALRAYYATELSHAGIASKDIQAGGGWSSDYVLKRVYERERYTRDSEIRKKTAATIANSLK